MKHNLKYTKERLTSAVKNSKSIADVIRFFGLRQSGGNSSHLRKRIDALGVSTKHFTGSAWNVGKKHKFGPDKKHWTERLRVYMPSEVLPNSAKLRRALLESGRPEECERCGITDWLFKKLVFQFDHVNGDRFNCLPSNVRFLCPNCHSQTETFGARNIRKSC